MNAATRARHLATARRLGCRPDEAEDVLQEALLAAWRAGRLEDGAYITGILRRQASMAARTAARRTRRETAWADVSAPGPEEGTAALPPLPPALARLARLAQAGCTRAEIRWLLGLSDTALRQRISALRRKLRGHPLPRQIAGAGGARRAEMGAALARRPQAHFASHDPDGHVFLVSRSQMPKARQQGIRTT
ncbi:sigma factor [Pseudoroseicyclus sp. H15]